MRRPVRPLLTPLEDRCTPAAIGALDPSFAAGGVLSTNFLAGKNSAYHAAIGLPNGSVVTVGTDGADFVVARVLANGNFDPTFGTAGKTTIDFGGTLDEAFAVATDSQGRIVVAGTTNSGNGAFAVARLTAVGGLDPTFDTDGKATINVTAGADIAYAIAIGATDDITLAGEGNATATSVVAIARLTAAGAADTTFGTGGTGANTFSTGGGDEARALFVQTDGKLVLAGSSGKTTKGTILEDAIAFRVLANGSAVDNTFGNKAIFAGGGTAKVYDFGGTDKFLGGTQDAAGRYVLVGATTNANDGLVARITADGTLDTTFNTTGSVFISYGATETELGVDVDPVTGKIVVAGNTGTGAATSITLTRLTAAGAFDVSFDADGKATYPVGTADSPFGVVRLPDGDYVAVGKSAANAVALRVVGTVGLPSGVLVTGQPNGGGQTFAVNAGRTGYTTPGTDVTLIDGTTTIHAALADVNNDGVLDRIAGTGPGGSRVVVRDGVTGDILFDTTAFEAGFTGGVYVAGGDFDNDGFADIVVTPDTGGGPRVLVFDGRAAAAGTAQVVADFLGLADTAGVPDTTFRGGLRPAVADVNGDGIVDLVVAAGFTGGPRVTVWDGTGVGAATGGAPTINPLANFFAFESALRDGAFVSVGDINGDGKADLIFGRGANAAPRVRIADAVGVLAIGDSSLDAEPGIDLADFVVDAPANGGVRVAARDIDGDQFADLVVGSGDGQQSTVRVYLGTAINATSGLPELAQDPIDPFGTTLANGVFVG
jgi:uncharacterized delta-60 repeat protein